MSGTPGVVPMKKREMLGAFAAARVLAAMPIAGQSQGPAAAAPAKVVRKGRIKQGRDPLRSSEEALAIMGV